VATRHELLVTEPDAEPELPAVVLAHGAGAPMDSPFMEVIATGLTARGLRTVRFEFPYMAARRESGSRRPPNRLPELEACWLEVIAQVRERWPAPSAGTAPVIGGKSMGGRVASRVADRAGVAGLVCLGYPFHPAGKPDLSAQQAAARTEHLAELATPTLIVQGTRDPFGTPDEVAGYRLSPHIRLQWLEDGDHSFKPRRASGCTEQQHLATAADAIAAFVRALP
jgi:hypothetical protein